MAKKGGSPENLDPVRSKEEARKRGRNGGKKSGEVRRRKREAKDAAKLILNLPASKTLSNSLKKLGVDEADFTNRVALFAKAFNMACKGNVRAMKFIIDIAGENPMFMLEQEKFENELSKQQGDNNAVDDWVDSIPEVESEVKDEENSNAEDEA